MMLAQSVVSQYFTYLKLNNPDFASMDAGQLAGLEQDMTKLIELILAEVKKAQIQVNVSQVMITNPLGLITSTGPVTGVAPAAGSGTGTATIMA